VSLNKEADRSISQTLSSLHAIDNIILFDTELCYFC